METKTLGNCGINTEYKSKCCCGYLKTQCNWHKYDTCSQNKITVLYYKLKNTLKKWN